MMRLAFACLLAAATLLMSGCGTSGSSNGPSEDKTTAPVGDVSSVKKACVMLIDRGTVDRALAITSDAAPDRESVQSSLFVVVSEGPAELVDPVGQLVDYLDDPLAYMANGKVSSDITDAAGAIRASCANA